MAAIFARGPQVRIRPVRVAAGLTLDQLAERISAQGVAVSGPHLSNVELGRQRASARLLRAWALALGVDPLDVWQPGRDPDTDDEGGVTEGTQAA